MTGHHVSGGWVIWCSLFIALLLSIVPLPSYLADCRPLWCALFFIYWALALPNRMSFAAAWIVGIFLDVLLNNLLGQNSLILIFILYITLLFQPKIRPQPIFQQCIIIAAILFLAQLLHLWINILRGNHPNSYLSFALPIFVSILIWPWLSVTMKSLQKRMRVNSP